MLDWRTLSTNEIQNGSTADNQRLISLFAREFSQVMDREICITCRSKFDSEYRSFIKRKYDMETKVNSGFKLKPMYEGIAIKPGSAKMLFSTNINDELAIEFIKEHPKGVDLFDKIPEGFDVDKAGQPSAVEVKAKEKKEDLIAEAELIAEEKGLEIPTGNKTILAQFILDHQASEPQE